MTPPDLVRFGRAAVRLGRVLAIREEGGAVRVYYEGCESVVFDGEDAEALRAFLSALADPWSALAGASRRRRRSIGRRGGTSRPARIPRGARGGRRPRRTGPARGSGRPTSSPAGAGSG
jgi:hypothetical protein